MKTIRATCPLCTQEVDLRPHEITLHIVDAAHAPITDGSRYGFACPHCEVFVVKPAGQHAIELLIEGGVELCTEPVAPWEHTSHTPHPESPPDGPPLTHDDLLDLHLALQRPGWFVELEQLAS
ncbi:MAG: hypothetical protein R3320_00475 [Nitriliruptorales bacterium]|nr:hypothetical protein [Nitriliruptorales bacterium]